MQDGRGLPASGNAADFLARDRAFRDKDLGVKRKDGKLTPGRCTGETELGINCERLAFAGDPKDEKQLHYKVKMAILLEREDQAVTEKLKEYGQVPDPSTVCPECNSKLSVTRVCLIDEDHEVPPAPAAVPKLKLSRWT